MFYNLYNTDGRSPAARLRELLGAPGIVMAPGAFSPLAARLVDQAGFDAVYITGSGTSADQLGLPDVGLATLGEMVTNARNAVSVVNAPVIADADTGYGNPINVIRTIREFEQAGVAAVHLEDQIWPKKCGHMEGKRLIARTEMVQKIRAAVDARRDPDFVIIARCDALAVEGLESALNRGEAYVDAGADVLMIEAPRSVEHLKQIRDRFPNTPLLYNQAASGKSPYLSRSDLEALGYKIVVLPLFVLLAAIRAMQSLLRDLRESGDVKDVLDRVTSWQEYYDLVGYQDVLALEKKYEVDDGAGHPDMSDRAQMSIT